MTTQSNAELDKAIDKMLTWNIQGHTEPVVFQPEMKKAIKKLVHSQQRQLLQGLMDDFPTLTKKTPDDSYNTGYDDAITEIETIIQNKLEGLS